MAKTVFILGAGASASTGVPLMNQFFQSACDLALDHPDSTLAACVRDVKAARDALKSVYAHSHIDLRNFEDLFSAIEMGRLVGRLHGLDAAAIERAADSVRTMVAEVICATSTFRWSRVFKHLAEEGADRLETYGVDRLDAAVCQRVNQLD